MPSSFGLELPSYIKNHIVKIRFYEFIRIIKEILNKIHKIFINLNSRTHQVRRRISF